MSETAKQRSERLCPLCGCCKKHAHPEQSACADKQREIAAEIEAAETAAVRRFADRCIDQITGLLPRGGLPIDRHDEGIATALDEVRALASAYSYCRGAGGHGGEEKSR